jgi:hypothetical protein
MTGLSQKRTSVSLMAFIHNLSTPQVFVTIAPLHPPERLRVCNRSSAAKRNGRLSQIA